MCLKKVDEARILMVPDGSALPTYSTVEFCKTKLMFKTKIYFQIQSVMGDGNLLNLPLTKASVPIFYWDRMENENYATAP
jgi:hypothetical protein